MVFQNHFTRFIYRRAHSGKLDKHLGAVAPLFDHAAHRSQMANSTGEAVEDCLCAFMVVVMVVVLVVVQVVSYAQHLFSRNLLNFARNASLSFRIVLCYNT